MSENTMQNFPGTFIVEIEHGFMVFAENREKCLEQIFKTIQKYETVCILKKTFTTSYHDAGGGHVIYILANSPWDARLKQIIGKNTCPGHFLFEKPEVICLSGLEEPLVDWDMDDEYMYSSPPKFIIESNEASAVREWARYDEDVSDINIFTLANIDRSLWERWGHSRVVDPLSRGVDSLTVRREYDIYPIHIDFMNSISEQHLYCYRAHLVSEEP